MRKHNERVKFKGFEFDVDYTTEEGIYIEYVGVGYEDFDPKYGSFMNFTEDAQDILSAQVLNFIYRRIEEIELTKGEEYLDDDR